MGKYVLISSPPTCLNTYDPKQLHQLTYSMERATVVMEELSSIYRVLDSSSELSDSDHTLIDTSIQAVVSEFDLVEIDGISVESKQDKTKYSKHFIVRVFQKLWKFIKDSVKWFLSLLGFDFSEPTAQSRLKKSQDRLKEIKELIKTHGNVADRVKPVPIDDPALLGLLDHLDKELNLGDFTSALNEHDSHQHFVAKVLDSLSKSVKVFETNLTKISSKADELVFSETIRSFDNLYDDSTKYLTVSGASKTSAESYQALFTSDGDRQDTLVASAPLLKGHRLYGYDTTIKAAKSLDVDTVFKLDFITNSYPSEFRARLKSFKLRELEILAEKSVKLAEGWIKEVKKADKASKELIKSLEILERVSGSQMRATIEPSEDQTSLTLFNIPTAMTTSIIRSIGQVRRFAGALDTSNQGLDRIIGFMFELTKKEVKVLVRQDKEELDRQAALKASST